MSRFNTRTPARPPVTSPVRTEAALTITNHQGLPAFARDAKSELFLLAVANIAGFGKDEHHEKADNRDSRFVALTEQVAVADPQWTAAFLRWLRGSANLRTASLVAAIEACRTMLAEGVPGGRQLIAAVLQRPDEPGEALAYWLANYGRRIPKPVKRAIADAALRLYKEYSLLKYDTTSHGVRFADVLELTHPGDQKGSSQGKHLRGQWQDDLFRHALARRRRRDEPTPQTLRMIAANKELRQLADDDPWVLVDTGRLRDAGMTWEDVLSLVGSKVDKAKLWEALIPVMGYSALMKNLRNFDEAGISPVAAAQVAARLTDPDQVAKSRELPIRFYVAYKAVKSLRWGGALELALNLSLPNIPKLRGRTLVLVDQSPSMYPGYGFSSRQSHAGIANHELAALFGSAVALRAENATLVGYGQASYVVPFARSEALLRVMEKFHVENGTDTFGAAADYFRGHDRVIICTDEQNNGRRYTSIDQVVPRDVPVYTWNIAGYQPAATSSGFGTRHTFGGPTDHAFKLIETIELGRAGNWDAIFGNAA